MWELDCKQSWAPNNWWFWTVVLKTLKSPLDCKIKPVHPKGNQSWIFIGRTDAEAKTPILWPPDGKNWLIGKDPDAGQDWRPEEKWMAEDEMVAWHHRLHGHEFEQAPGVGDGQRSLVCCSPWVRKESDMTEQLNWTEEKKRTVNSKLKSKLYKILSPLLSSSYDSHFSTRYLKLFCKYSIVFTLLSLLPLFLALLILCRSPGTSREQRKEEPWSGSFPAGKERSRGRKRMHEGLLPLCHLCSECINEWMSLIWSHHLKKVAQGWKLCAPSLPGQGAQVQSLVRELDPDCHNWRSHMHNEDLRSRHN